MTITTTADFRVRAGLGLSLLVAHLGLGCASEVVTVDGAPTQNIQESCGDGLCLDEGAEASLAEANALLAACQPIDDAVPGDPEGLRIVGVSLVGHEGGVAEVRVVLGNVLPRGVMTYPGTGLRVDDGVGSVVEPMAGQLYGIFGCGTTESTFAIDWDGTEPLALTALAMNELGESVHDEVAFTLEPGQ